MKSNILFNKKDIVLILTLITIGIVMGVFLLLSRTDNNAMCVVKVDGKVINTYALSEDGEYDIELENSAYNKLQIKDGKACIIEASCPDKLCQKMGYISHNTQSIICLPNKVVVSIESQGDNNIEVDAKTW